MLDDLLDCGFAAECFEKFLVKGGAALVLNHSLIMLLREARRVISLLVPYSFLLKGGA